MLLVKIALLLEIAAIAFVSFRRSGDFFSPAKVYLAYSTYFFATIFLQEVRWETLLCYFLLIQSIVLVAFLEGTDSTSNIVLVERDGPKLYRLIWVLSLPGFLTMIGFVREAGGIMEHLLSLAFRVEAWKGQGHLIILLNTLPTLTLLYFAKLLDDSRRTPLDIALYMVHFLGFVMVGIMTASRSFIAVPILGGYVMWTYLKRPPRFRYVLALIASLILVVSVLGTLRNIRYGGEDGAGFEQAGLEETRLENTQMAYGVMPLETIFGAPEKERFWGATYFTLMTNVIPRSLWPMKPDTAGLLFTKLYTEDDSGFSYYATGAVTEAVMNFGKAGGLAFGSVLNLGVLLAGCLLYGRVFQPSPGAKVRKSVFKIITYFYFVLAAARLSYGEFTDIFQSLIFFNLIPLIVVRFLYQTRFS